MAQEKVNKALLGQQKQLINTAQLMAESVNDWQVIQSYLTGRMVNLQLTSKQQEKLVRYQFIYNQLVSGKYTEAEVCEMIQETYGLSYVQALQDLRDSKEVFTATLNINKIFELKVQLELNKVYQQMAKDAGDWRALAAFEKNREKLLARVPDVEESHADDFTPHVNIFTFDPALLGVQQFTEDELQDLLQDIKKRYGGIVPGMQDISDAEIIE